MQRVSSPKGEATNRELDAERIFAQISGRWSLQILMALAGGHHRFTDLKHAIPAISAKLLTARLRELEMTGLVERSTLPPPAASQVYELGALAIELIPALNQLRRWRAQLARHK